MYPDPCTFLKIEAGRPLLVLSCSQEKADIGDRYAPFTDLYDGPMWRQVKLSRFPLTNVAAISALYGFLEPGHPVHAYDRQMDEKTSKRHCSTGSGVAVLANAVEVAGGAFVVGGKMYQELARTAVRWRPSLEPLIAFAEGSYLQQRKQLGQWLREKSCDLSPPLLTLPAPC